MLIDEIEKAANDAEGALEFDSATGVYRGRLLTDEECYAAQIIKSPQWPRIREALKAGNVCADYCHSDYPDSNEAYKNACKFREAMGE